MQNYDTARFCFLIFSDNGNYDDFADTAVDRMLYDAARQAEQTAEQG